MMSLVEQLNGLLSRRLAGGKLEFFVRANKETGGALVDIMERRERLMLITLATYHVTRELSVRRAGRTIRTPDALELEMLLQLDIEERRDNLLALLTERRIS